MLNLTKKLITSILLLLIGILTLVISFIAHYRRFSLAFISGFWFGVICIIIGVSLAFNIMISDTFYLS